MIFLTKEEKKAIEEFRKQLRLAINIDDVTTAIRNDNAQTILNLIEKLQEENETLKCSIAVANKLEELIKEDFIPKGKIVDIIEKISLYKKLAKESFNNSIGYGRMQAHSADMSMLQKLLESEE